MELPPLPPPIFDAPDASGTLEALPGRGFLKPVLIAGGIGASVLLATAIGYWRAGGLNSQDWRELQRRQAQKRRKAQMGGMGGMPGMEGMDMDMAAMLSAMQGGGGGGEPGPQAPALPPGYGDASALAAQQNAKMSLEQIKQETQQLLQIVFMKCEEYMMQGLYEEASKLYRQGMQLIPPEFPEAMDVKLQLASCAATADISAGVPEQALDFLDTLKYEVAQTDKVDLHIAFNAILSKIYQAMGREEEAVDLTLLNTELIQELYGESSKEYASHLVQLAVLMRSIEKYDDCISLLHEAIPVLKNANYGTISREIYAAYLHLEITYLLKKDLQTALSVLASVEKQANPDDISLYWHFSHLAGALVENGFDEESERQFKRVLEKWQDNMGGNKRLISLVGNTMNEYAVLLYNLGREDEAESYMEIVKEKRWGLLTSSKYMTTKTSTILFTPDGNSDQYSGLFKISLTLKPLVEVGSVLEFKFETSSNPNPEIKEVVVTEKMKNIGLDVTSRNYREFEVKTYRVDVNLYTDETKETLLYTHIQHVPSSIDTASTRSWTELQRSVSRR